MTTDDRRFECLRPNGRVFVIRPIIRTAFVTGTIAVVAHLFLPLFANLDPGLGVWLGAALAVVAFVALNRFVAYRRTFYEFYDDRLVVKTGTIATRSTVDLPYRNVTQVKLRLPWIEHRLFSTGHLSIHAAGSARGIAHLHSVDNPREVYQAMADHLRENGFSLTRNQKLQCERPHLMGTALDTSGLALGAVLALITFGMTIAGTIVDVLELDSYYELYDVLVGAVETDDPDDAQAAHRSTVGLALVAVVGGTFGLGKLALHFVDLNRRVYTLWDDVVDYEDGFLTETHKFVPIENLADTSTNEPLLKRLFGMADVHLSPHGSASGIRFPSMPRAEQFRGHLDRLIESSDGPRQAGDDVTDADKAPPSAAGAVERRLADASGPALEFGPSFARRALTGIGQALKFPAVAVTTAFAAWWTAVWMEFDPEEFGIFADVDDMQARWIIYTGLALFAGLAIYQLGAAALFCWTTTYRVGRRKVSWERDFISRDEVEFTNDKITTLETQRDLVDRIMGTTTVVFRSIGNATPLVFNDIADGDERTDELRRRLGLLRSPDEADRSFRPTAHPVDLFVARLYTTLFVWLVAAGGAVAAHTYWPPGLYVAAAVAVLPIIRILYHAIYYPRCRLHLFDDHLAIHRGIVFLERQYVAYDQLRSVVTTRYPTRSTGTLRLIPGSATTLSLPYLDDIEPLHEELDERLYDRPMQTVPQPETLDRTDVSNRTPQARNRLLLAGVFTLSAAIATVVPAVLIYLYARRTDIVVEQSRVRRLHGLLYRTTQTVLTNRIDQLLIDRGPVNTLFGNGRVSVLTVGSTTPALVLGPVSDEQSLYDELESLLT